MITKIIISWALFALGLIIIFGVLFYSYNIFTGKSNPPEIFKIKASVPAVQAPAGNSQLSQQDLAILIQAQVGQIVPANFINRILNLISWSIFAGIFFFGGGKISEIGMRLMKADSQQN